MNRLFLRSGHDRRLRSGHPWVFSNEVASIEGKPTDGEAIAVTTHGGEFLGTAYYNPHSLIAARIVSRQKETIDTVEFFHRRIEAAFSYRRGFYQDTDALRIVYGESDGLPGLVVDRYGTVLCIQFLTLGMERRREAIITALLDLFRPTAIIARNDALVRELEGLPRQVEILYGQMDEEVEIRENGLRFLVDVQQGQKTGHFLDQKENHKILQGRVQNRRVLDLFCYSGSWSVHAACYGAASVTGIDISAGAVALAGHNARINDLEDKCSFVRADVFDYLREQSRLGERFGTITLDPPAFVKSRKKLPEAIKGYLTINRRAMELLEPGGILVTCSCSYHLSRETFLDILHKAANQAGRTVILQEMRGQALDHPVLLACPETDYLKCAVLYVR
jgi:23S rRNA (cytosine1962-C5)-methyltransferase